LKVYLAGAFSRQAELRAIATDLDALGVEVTSRWLYETGPENPKDRQRYRRETAFKDVQDVRAADILVRFTDDLSTEVIPSYLGSCARMFEFGMAWERGIPVVTVGGQQNVFDSLPNIIHLPDVQALYKFLSPRET
jgi:hypothetical protein